MKHIGSLVEFDSARGMASYSSAMKVTTWLDGSDMIFSCSRSSHGPWEIRGRWATCAEPVSIEWQW